VRRPYANGLSFLANYTFAKSLENAPHFRSPMFEAATPQNNDDLNAEKGPGCDIRNRFALSAVYSPKAWKRNSFTRAVTRDWTGSMEYQAQTGFPFTVTQSGDRSLTSSPGERADRLCEGALSGGERRRERWFDTSCFAVSPLGRFGNGGRNTLRFPGQNNLDFSLIKQTPIADKARLEFRSEFFNLPNHTQFSLTGGMGSSVSSPTTFGTISAAMDPRILQFSLRLLF